MPDEIYIRINLSENESKGKISLDQQQREMFRRLEALHLDLEKNLVVQDQSADLRTFFLRKDAVLGTKTYLLKVSTATQVGQVFQTLAEMGVSDVNIERTDVSNMDELRQKVRAAAAVAAARMPKCWHRRSVVRPGKRCISRIIVIMPVRIRT